MTDKLRLLIVEDEAAIRTGLVDVFVFHGYDVDIAVDGPMGLQKARQGRYDLILLDIMLPGMNGLEVCEHIRANNPDQPIIMLTAKSSDEDIIRGLSLGADDYVAKPFSVAQLVLRVKAVLRRTNPASFRSRRITLDSKVWIDCDNLHVHKEGTTEAFTRRETDILIYLAHHTDRPISRQELLNKVWGYAKDLELETRTVDIHIAKIRRKIEPNPKKPQYLITVRGGGYRLLTKQPDSSL